MANGDFPSPGCRQDIALVLQKILKERKGRQSCLLHLLPGYVQTHKKEDGTKIMARQWDNHEALHLVDQIYQQVLERSILNADGNSMDSGSMYYTDKLRQGEMSIRDVVRAIGLSQEYTQRFIIPNTNANAIRFCYKHFLAREPEEKGLNYWRQQSMIGGWPVVILGLVDSDEYTERFGNDAVPQ